MKHPQKEIENKGRLMARGVIKEILVWILWIYLGLIGIAILFGIVPHVNLFILAFIIVAIIVFYWLFKKKK